MNEHNEEELVYLIPFKNDRQICPECLRIYPKFRLPLLNCCVHCPDEHRRRINKQYEEYIKSAKPK